jgi:hypothetical protein
MSAGPDDGVMIGGDMGIGMVNLMVQVSVTLAIGVLIVGKIFNALPTTPVFSSASTQVQELTATAFELAPVILIVLVASVVIGVVRQI